MILINDLGAHARARQDVIRQALERVVSSGWFVMGPEVRAFEEEFSTWLGVSRTLGVGNGTDALELALRALGVTRNDTVATVANAGMYTCTALLAIGAKPFFMDVDPQSGLASLVECERALDAGVKAVVVTHLYGLAVPDIEAIADRCRRSAVPLIEDCAQAHGAVINGRKTGTFGDIGCFSFYPTKNLGALGDGGAVVVRDAGLGDRLAQLRQYGWSGKYTVSQPGGRNSRLDEMQAAVLREFLPLLDGWNERRRQIARRYASLITHQAVSLPRFEADEYVAHLYVVRTRNPAGLKDHLQAYMVGSDVHYPIPDHRQSVFAGAYDEVALPVTEQLAGEILTLPCYPEMSDNDVQQVAEAVNTWKA